MRSIKLNYTQFAIPNSWDDKKIDTFVALCAQLQSVGEAYPDIDKVDDIVTHDCTTVYAESPVEIRLYTSNDTIPCSSKATAVMESNYHYNIKIATAHDLKD
jgi:hypothetical protein